MSSFLSDPDFDEEENSEKELSPLLQAIAPKLLRCRIREYMPEDLDACLDIYRSNVGDYLPAEGLESFEEFLQYGTSYYLVLEYDGEVVACGGLELVGDSDTAALVHGMVHGQIQRQGFGTTLLAARLSLLDCEERPQEVWVKTTAATLPFYGRFGFEYHSAGTRESSGQAKVWLSLDDQDVEDIRTALHDRGIQIFLNDPADDEEDEEEDA